MWFLPSRQPARPSPTDSPPGRPDPIMTLGLHTVLGGEIELPAAAGPWRVLLSSHDTARPEVGSRVAVGPLEAIILELEPTTIDG